MHSKADLEPAIELMQSCLANKVAVEHFCRWYENFWNFELLQPSADEGRALEALFDEVVLFSPFPRNEWGYPAYRDEAEIRQAIGVTLSELTGTFSEAKL